MTPDNQFVHLIFKSNNPLEAWLSRERNVQAIVELSLVNPFTPKSLKLYNWKKQKN